MGDHPVALCLAPPLTWPHPPKHYRFIVMAEEHPDDSGPAGPTVAVAKARPKLKRPPLYKVLLINDDYTPMEFVVHVLEQFFSMDRPKAVQVMLAVHTQGKGICGLYTREIAETRVAQVNDYARGHQHPLLCTMEADD
jgi:ATP-dependent Clp protease adaptor protein ClpS